MKGIKRKLRKNIFITTVAILVLNTKSIRVRAFAGQNVLNTSSEEKRR